MKILKADRVEIKEYRAHSFTQNQENLSNMQIKELFRKRANKECIKKLAKRYNISGSEKQIAFATEIINIMLDEINQG